MEHHSKNRFFSLAEKKRINSDASTVIFSIPHSLLVSPFNPPKTQRTRWRKIRSTHKHLSWGWPHAALFQCGRSDLGSLCRNGFRALQGSLPYSWVYLSHWVNWSKPHHDPGGREFGAQWFVNVAPGELHRRREKSIIRTNVSSFSLSLLCLTSPKFVATFTISHAEVR